MLQTAIMLSTSRGGRGAASFSKCEKGSQKNNKKRKRKKENNKKRMKGAYLDNEYYVNEVGM